MKEQHFWGIVNVGSKGQVVIPAKARKRFNINEGDQLLVLSPHGKAGLMMIKAQDLEKTLSHIQNNIQETLASAQNSLNVKNKG